MFYVLYYFKVLLNNNQIPFDLIDGLLVQNIQKLFNVPQVQFDEREDTKVCTIVINDDQVFENIESFNVELSMPVYALLGSVTRAKVNINDTEDEPTLQFDKKTYHVNESTGFIFAPIERKGQWN